MRRCLILAVIAVFAITNVAARCRVGRIILQNHRLIWNRRCNMMFVCSSGSLQRTSIAGLTTCPEHSHCNGAFRRCVCDEGFQPIRRFRNIITACGVPTTTHALSTTTPTPAPTTAAPTAPSSPVSSTPLQLTCPDRTWTLVSGDRCIKAYSSNGQKKTYDAALVECRVYNADLFMVNSHEQFTEVKRLLMKGYRYWIGVRDTDDNGPGTFKYINGQMLTSYQPWAIRQPDNRGGNEFCVEMIANRKGRWNDKRCSRRNRFICEKRNIGLVSH